MKVDREKCGDCHHGAHPSGPCVTTEVSGPPVERTRGDHAGRDVTPCTCKVSTPYRNGIEVGCVMWGRLEEHVPVGTFTLCQICHYAIVVDRHSWPHYETGEEVVAHLWRHTGQFGITDHPAEPVRTVI